MKLKQEVQARQYLETALSVIENEPDPGNRLSVQVELTELQAQWGELDAAKARFQKLLKISGSDEENGSDFQTIAFSQIRVGLLDDAYITIKRIVDPNLRIGPLLKLAHQSAKLQAERRKESGIM